MDEDGRNAWTRHWIAEGFAALEAMAGEEAVPWRRRARIADLCLGAPDVQCPALRQRRSTISPGWSRSTRRPGAAGPSPPPIPTRWRQSEDIRAGGGAPARRARSRTGTGSGTGPGRDRRHRPRRCDAPPRRCRPMTWWTIDAIASPAHRQRPASEDALRDARRPRAVPPLRSALGAPDHRRASRCAAWAAMPRAARCCCSTACPRPIRSAAGSPSRLSPRAAGGRAGRAGRGQRLCRPRRARRHDRAGER